MKRSLFLACAANALLVHAQNLVPNPSFEAYTECPSAYNEFFKVEDWFAIGNGGPELYNVCDGSEAAGAPSNIFGFQHPATGNGYCGMWAFSNSNGPFGLHEVVGVPLTGSLIVGQIYWASLKVSWTSGAPIKDALTGFASNKMGLLLRMDSLPDQASWEPWPNTAHVYTETIITDSVNWTIISGQFMADSAYRYLYVGNFFGDDHTDAVVVDPGGDGFSYYYVDDVCLSMNAADCPLATGIAEKDDTDAPWVLWNGLSNTINVTKLPPGFYTATLYDTLGRIVLRQSVSSGGLQQTLAIPLLQGMASSVILDLQDGRREWHFKLLPSIP